MAKRHNSLIRLSHDHHHGLALAVRLKQGDHALLTDGWTHDKAEQTKRVERFYREELQPHFAAEERALFPAMKHHIPTSASFIDDLIRQHRTLERSVDGISSSTSGEVGKELATLGELLERHIRVEERELFPLFEEHFPRDLALQVGEDITQVHQEVASALRSVIHVREEMIVNARTESIYAALAHVSGYPRWWEDASVVADGHGGGGEHVLVRLAGERLPCRVVERQMPRLVRMHAAGEEYQGDVNMIVEDAPGGLRIVFEANIDPVTPSSGDRPREKQLERRLSDSFQNALLRLSRSLTGM